MRGKDPTVRTCLCGLMCVLVIVGAAAAGDAAPTTILDEGSSWRAFVVWRTPVVREGEALVPGPNDSYGPSFVVQTPDPPAGWTAPDFDDTTWSRLRVSTHNRVVYGFDGGGGPAMAVQCLRGKFHVADPAAVKGMNLTLEYRGGVVVYLNGREIARRHLPAGDLGADTPAEDYPHEAFEFEPGKCIMGHAVHAGGSIQRNPEELALRLRRIEPIAIRSADLRKGTNVLAVEVRRAPYYGAGLKKENLNHRSIWSTGGLVRLSLVAAAGAAPNVARPGGVQVWPTSVLRRSRPEDYPDPLDQAEPLTITGCRNGRFVGKVTVSSAEALEGVQATVTDLVAAGGATIPASAVTVLYSVRDDQMLMRRSAGTGFWDTLLAEPPARVEPVVSGKTPVGAVQPILLKVAVPADARPGDYAGQLTVAVNGRKHPVPVRLRVIDFRLPDPRDYVTHMGLVQSPETVALQYDVPLWSERHWDLMEPSFRLMAEVGNKYVVLPMIARTNFGNSQTLVRWVKDGDGWTFDFTLFERYLDLAQKYLDLQVVCLYVWDVYFGQHTWTNREKEGTEPYVTRWDPQTGKSEEIQVPKYETAEGAALWKRLYAEALARLEKRGLKDQTMIGISSEWAGPNKPIAAFLQETFPGIKWVKNPHQDCRGGQVAGIPIGYHTSVYVGLFPPPGQATRRSTDGYYYGWQSMSAIFPRAGGPATNNPLYPQTALSVHRFTIEAAQMANFAGLGRTGIDFWPVLEPKSVGQLGGSKRSYSLNARYPETVWAQLNMDTATECLSAPGPVGAVTTERFEQVREGVQDCEARIVIEKALLSGTLNEATAKACRAVLDERAWRIRAACMGRDLGFVWYERAGSAGLAERLFTAAAEVTRTGP